MIYDFTLISPIANYPLITPLIQWLIQWGNYVSEPLDNSIGKIPKIKFFVAIR
jgi:hypothetical protein